MRIASPYRPSTKFELVFARVERNDDDDDDGDDDGDDGDSQRGTFRSHLSVTMKPHLAISILLLDDSSAG